ncbi:hypothetical protein SAMN04487905_11377 [Actinopolyspora xinjiangensis]|uniref:Uncharacterized protein n=1 Tax=Actinopolyspora xinjiangensis TaxID=405564 RepID=A0A1H0WNG7_9ACTN|nr:hypothetical protein [Actinopolyspora xinjiangensis]SDP92151.1 hypothetical protein SAMN04487905_11377 [Actinopolyspora xinjiangensis]
MPPDTSDRDHEIEELKSRLAAYRDSAVADAQAIRFRILYAALGSVLLALSGGPWLHSHEHRDYESTVGLFRLFELMKPDSGVVVSEDYGPVTGVVPVVLVALAVGCLGTCVPTSASMPAHASLAAFSGIAAVLFGVFVGTTSGDASAGASAWLALMIAISIAALAAGRAVSLKQIDGQECRADPPG